MTYTSTSEDVRCQEGTGNITEVGGDQCRTTPTDFLDVIAGIEALCIFPFYLDGNEYNECTLTEIQDFTKPKFICPIRTLKGRSINYTIEDVDQTYCPTNDDGPVINSYNGELELDPNNDRCGSGRPVFATCKNTCPGGETLILIDSTHIYILFSQFSSCVRSEAVTNTYIINLTFFILINVVTVTVGGFALLTTTGAVAGPGLTGALPALLAGVGIVGAAGMTMMASSQCLSVAMCSAPSGQCCFLALDRGRIVCPLSC